jgi:uncharacterized protein YwqG
VSDRRAFFRELLREAAGVAQELSATVRAATETEHDDRVPPAPARPATAVVDEETLVALCREAGLAHRADDVRRSARVSFRLTRGDPSSRSYLGGVPEVPPGFVWPSWHGRALGFLAQVDLAEAAALDRGTVLPHRGLMLFFYDLAERPSGLSPTGGGSCRVVVVDGDATTLAKEHVPALRVYPLEPSRELVLPGAWSFQAEGLDLTHDERDAWDELRDRLAGAQGVELEETTISRSVLHRLLGYHEEIGREVEVDCALAAAGLDAGDVDVYYAKRPLLEADARRWRLLLQVSGEDSDAFERLYVLIRDDELRAGAFDGVWAVCRR